MKKMTHILTVLALLALVNLSAQQAVPSDHELYVENIVNKLTEKFVAQGRLTFQPGPAPERSNGYDKDLLGNTRLNSAAWSPDGTKVLTTSADSAARIWNPQTGQTLHTLVGHTGSVLCAAWSPDGSRVVTGSSDRTTRLWNAQTGACLQILSFGSGSGVHAVAWSPDGTKIATVFNYKNIRISDAQTGACLMTLVGHADNVVRIEWSPDSTTLLSASVDHTARTWNVVTRECTHILRHNHRLATAHWSPDGTKIATASSDDTACIWNAQTGERLQTLNCTPDDIDWSPDGKRVVTVSRYMMAQIWDVLTGACVHTLTGHSDSVCAGVWSPDGKKIATASNDYSVRVWSALTGLYTDKKSFIRPPRTLEWSPDSTHVVVKASFDPSAFIFRVTDGDSIVNNLKLLENFFLQEDQNSQDFLLLRLLAGLYDQHGAGERITKNLFSGAYDVFKTIPPSIKTAARIVFKLSDDFFEKDEIKKEERL